MHNFQRFSLALALFAAVATLAACSTTEPPEQQLDDAGITSEVKAGLAADSDVNPFDIDVDTQDGVVTLRGTVDDTHSIREAVRIARATSGVMRVENQIEVGGGMDPEMELDDAAIATEVKAKLTADTDVSAVNIDVDVRNGVVHLSGVVRTVEARREAADLALDVEGVRGVRNGIEVE